MNEKVKHIDTLVKICGFFVVGAEVRKIENGRIINY